MNRCAVASLLAVVAKEKCNKEKMGNNFKIWEVDWTAADAKQSVLRGHNHVGQQQTRSLPLFSFFIEYGLRWVRITPHILFKISFYSSKLRTPETWIKMHA